MKDTQNDEKITSPVPTPTSEPLTDPFPSARNAEEWLEQMPARIRRMATDPAYRALVESRTV